MPGGKGTKLRGFIRDIRVLGPSRFDDQGKLEFLRLSCKRIVV
jgi:hypothetical protein